MSIMSDGAAASETGEQQTQQTAQQTPPAVEQQQQTTQQTPPAAEQQQTTQQSATEWLPEAYRNDPAFGKFKTLDDLCKSQKHLQTLIGKKTVARPDANSTEAEWQEWYRDNGEPDDPGDYELGAVEGLPQEFFTKEMLAPYRAAFKKAHIPADSAKLLWQARNEYLKQEAAAREQRLAARNEAEAAKLRQEWGDDYAKNFNKAYAAFGKLFPGVDARSCALCNDPLFIRGMLRAYDAVKDDTMPEGTGQLASALSAIDDRISAIYADPAYRSAANPDHARLVAEMVDLQRRKGELKSRIK